jgi:hypothetical protein
MMLSFVAYILGFLTLGFAREFAPLLLAMLFLAVGDAFRTGTHKAMIFTWLRINDRSDERTQVYGYTRSWSKIGSAVSAIAAAIFVLLANSYTLVFFFAVVPYALNLVNFLGYPEELEGERSESSPSPREVMRHMNRALSDSLRRSGLRRLMFESMGFEGVFHAVKDYLQPVVALAAVAAASRYSFSEDLSEVQQSALLVGPVYLVLHLLSSVASRNVHRIVDRVGSEENTSHWMWGASIAVFALLFVAGLVGVSAALIVTFMVLFVLQDAWRPVLISRFDEHSTEAQGAIILSIESQSRRFATMLLAPVIGLAIDATRGDEMRSGDFWPIGLIGIAVGLLFFFTAPRRGTAAVPAASETSVASS